MRPFIMLIPALLAGMELPAPSLEVHPDGARVAWDLSLPAGSHRIDLPAWCGNEISVRGASAWSRQEEAGKPAPMPEALVALLPERNRLMIRAAAHAAAEATWATTEKRWRESLAQQASAGVANPTAWQTGLDALLDERTRLDGEKQGLDAERQALADRAVAATGAEVGARMLALNDPQPLTVTGLSQDWSRNAGSRPLSAHLDLQLAEAGTIRIEEQRSDCRWRAECDLRISGGSAVLVRRAVIEKPAAFAPGRTGVTASAAPLAPRLAAPQPPAMTLVAMPVAEALRKLIGSGRRQATWDEVQDKADPSAARTSAPSAVENLTMQNAEAGGSGAFMALGAGGGSAGMFGNRTGSGRRRALKLQENSGGMEGTAGEVAPSSAIFDLGVLDLASGSDRRVAALGETALTIVTDEWALFPEERPAALRRVTVKLDGRPLLPGCIRVVGEGQLPVEGTVPWVPGGGTLTVCAGIDERMVVVESRPWKLQPDDQGKQRRREGRDFWLVNASPQPATVAVYRTLPVSTADEVRVETDPATTPGSKAVIPGLLRWEMQLPPGVPTCISLGWTLKASGSFTFE